MVPATLALGGPSLPTDHPDLFQKHLLHVLRANHSHVTATSSSKQQGVPPRPLGAKIGSFAHMTAPARPLICFHLRTSKICFLHARLPSSHPHTFCPTVRGHGGHIIHSIKKCKRGGLFLACCCCCHLRPQLQPFCTRDAHGFSSPHSRRDQGPSSTTSAL